MNKMAIDCRNRNLSEIQIDAAATLYYTSLQYLAYEVTSIMVSPFLANDILCVSKTWTTHGAILSWLTFHFFV